MTASMSLWHKETNLPDFQTLDGDMATDILIIGGGLAGLLCAFQLQRAGMECLVVEAGRICGGVTGNTTAKLTSQHGLLYHKLTRSYGLDAARLYLEANQAALEQYRSLCPETRAAGDASRRYERQEASLLCPSR